MFEISDYQQKKGQQPRGGGKPMKQEYSLAHLTVLECSPAEMVRIAAKTGYDYVSIRLIPLGIPGERAFLPQDKQMVREMKNALNETGVKFLDLELARILPDNSPQDYIAAMELAAELGARHVISSAWTNVRDDRNFVIERYAEICELASPFRMTVELEFPTFSRLENLQEAADIVRSANAANCGILLDTLYLHFTGCPVDEIKNIPPEWIHFLHICDTVPEVPDTREGKIHIARDDRRYIGEGCIDFQSIFNAVPAVPFSIELPNLEQVKRHGYEEHARRCIESARSYLDKYPVLRNQKVNA